MNRKTRPPVAKTQVADASAKSAFSQDGLQNVVLKVGEGATVMGGTRYVPSGTTRNYQQLEQMYRGSWVVGKAVDAVAEDMTRAGITLMGISKAEDGPKIQRALTRKGVWTALTLGLKWARLYGGAGAFIMIDGQDPSTPLRLETVAKDQFKGLKIYDRWSLQPSMTYKIQSGPDIGLPEYYNVPRIGLTIHHSRFIRLTGIDLPYLQAEQEEYWGMSVVERIRDALIPYSTGTASAAQLMQKSFLRTVQVDKLREILAGGGTAEANLIKMFALMSELQSSQGITLLDKEDTFEAHTYTFSGVGDMLLQFAQQISGATDIPLTRLLGQSPGGLGGTGEGEMEQYHEGVGQKQEDKLRQGLQWILDIMHMSVLGKLPGPEFDFEFNSLQQMNVKEKAETAERLTKTIVEAYKEDLIDRPTAMRELKYVGTITGVFTNITDEMVDEAQDMVDDAKEAPPGEGDLDPMTGLPKPPPPVVNDPNADPKAKPPVKAASGQAE